MARYLEIAAGAKRGINWDAFRDVADPEKGVEKYDMRQLPMRGIVQYKKYLKKKNGQDNHSLRTDSIVSYNMKKI